MEQWLVPFAAFALGWTTRPIFEPQEVKVTPCNCLCTCECISRDQNTGVYIFLLIFIVGLLGVLSLGGYFLYRHRESTGPAVESPSKGKKGFAGTKGQILTLTN